MTDRQDRIAAAFGLASVTLQAFYDPHLSPGFLVAGVPVVLADAPACARPARPRVLPAGFELSAYRIAEHLLDALQDTPGLPQVTSGQA